MEETNACIDDFYFNKIVQNLDIEYNQIDIIFRRSFPFAYPGTDGERRISHTWKVRYGNTYYSYIICRNCFDVRVLEGTNIPEKVVQTGLCTPCGVDPAKSRHYWDAIYTTLCSCPLVGDRFEHCILWKLPRVHIHHGMPKVGPIRRITKVSKRLRYSSLPEQVPSGSESDTDSYSLQTL